MPDPNSIFAAPPTTQNMPGGTFKALGAPTSTVGSAPASPTYQNILGILNQPLAGQNNFNNQIGTIQGQITKPGTLDPGYQATLDAIKSQAAYYGAQAGSAASSLAQKRGLAGSSIEQFGVQTGVNNVNREAQSETAGVYQQNLQQQQALQASLAQAYGARSQLQGQAGTQLAQTGAQLTSDEIASLRNQQFQQQQLQLQSQLGNAAIQQGNNAISAGQNLAQKQGQNQLITGAANLLAPYVLPGILGSPGAQGTLGIPQLGGAGAGGVPGFGALGPNGLPIGTQGPGLPGSAADAGIGLGGAAAIGAAGAGAMSLAQKGNQIAGTPGAILANPLGAQLNFAKNFVSNPGQTVNNALGTGGSHQQEEGSAAWQSSMTQDQQAVNLGKPGMTINYDSNKKGSFEQNYNVTLNAFSPDQLVQRYASATPDMLQTNQDKSNQALYQKAVSQYGPGITGAQFANFAAAQGNPLPNAGFSA